MNFVASAPAKLILFGEWAVLDGHPALGVALSSRFSIVQKKSTSTDHINFNTIEENHELNDTCQLQTKAPKESLFLWAYKILNTLNPSNTATGLDYFFNREWPIKEGLGSSSATYLCLKALQQIKNTPVDNQVLSKIIRQLQADALELKNEIIQLQGGRGSGFDMLIQLFGNSLYLEQKKIQSLNLNFPENLWLIHTGEKFSTSQLLDGNKGPDAQNRLKLGKICENFLNDQNWHKAISQSFGILAKTGLVPTKIQLIKQTWIQRGLIEEMKTSGAGGGDTLITLINPEKKTELENEITQLKWWRSHHAFQAEGLTLERSLI